MATLLENDCRQWIRVRSTGTFENVRIALASNLREKFYSKGLNAINWRVDEV
jgi:hypothetical protein